MKPFQVRAHDQGVPPQFEHQCPVPSFSAMYFPTDTLPVKVIRSTFDGDHRITDVLGKPVITWNISEAFLPTKRPPAVKPSGVFSVGLQHAVIGCNAWCDFMRHHVERMIEGRMALITPCRKSRWVKIFRFCPWGVRSERFNHYPGCIIDP